jgi:hypothetical protein
MVSISRSDTVSEWEWHEMLGPPWHKDMHEVRDEVMQGVQDAWDNVTEKDTYTINLTGPEKDFWMGSETGMLGCYWFRAVVFAGDGSHHRGRMGAWP